MITAAMRAEMRRLVLVEGWRIETVARRYGVHHSVVRRALHDDAGERPAPTSALDSFKPYIVERLVELPQLSCVRLVDELRARGYTLGVALVRRYVAQVRPPRRRKAYLRIETDPGQQAQVDWGSFGHMRVGAGQRPLSGVRDGAVVVARAVHRLRLRPADGNVSPHAPSGARVLWRCAQADRL